MSRVYVIAELGSNHQGSLQTAKDLIYHAKECGADAAKLQLYTAHGLAHPDYPYYAALQKSALPREWMPELMFYAREVGIDLSATPCDLEAVDLLESLDVPWLKIASGDLTYRALIERAAQTGRWLIISTGAATKGEVETARRWALAVYPGLRLTLLQCVVAYPAEAGQQKLEVLRYLPFLLTETGFSDHTLSLTLPAVAVGLGATVIEKHFTLSRQLAGPDHGHSLEPHEFAQMVQYIREAEKAMRDDWKGPLPEEQTMRVIARRGLYWASDLPVGHVVQPDDLLALRPAGSVSPADAQRLVGCEVIRPVKRFAAVEMAAVGLPTPD